MENQAPANEKDSGNKVNKSDSLQTTQPADIDKKDLNILDKQKVSEDLNVDKTPIPKKPVKPPKVEEKPFEEFINDHLIPKLKSSIEDKGTSVSEIKLIEGKRPVVGDNCWMIFCEIYNLGTLHTLKYSHIAESCVKGHDHILFFCK